jgi:small nuclear ribonucleoprotein (snRNP)-like protein
VFTRKKPPVLDELLLRRVAVNLVENGVTLFTGRFTGYDDRTLVFEQCETYPSQGEVPRPITGRQYIDRIHVWPGELPT